MLLDGLCNEDPLVRRFRRFYFTVQARISIMRFAPKQPFLRASEPLLFALVHRKAGPARQYQVLPAEVSSRHSRIC